MKYKCIGVNKISPTITIREFSNGNVESRYFRAVICGWRDFKFISDTLKPQQLLEKTIAKCKEMEAEIGNVDLFPSLFKIN